MTEENREVKVSQFSCMDCNRNASINWWKCCPEHTTEQGDDVKCQDCYAKAHPEKMGESST